MIKLKTLRKL